MRMDHSNRITIVTNSLLAIEKRVIPQHGAAGFFFISKIGLIVSFSLLARNALNVFFGLRYFLVFSICQFAFHPLLQLNRME
jgi:hypothetical protein